MNRSRRAQGNVSAETDLIIRQVSKTTETAVFERFAAIHRAEITDGFLSSLGPRFLSNLYRALADSHEALCYFAEHNGRVEGFICGATDTARVYRRFLLRSSLRSVIVLAPRLFSPARILRVLEVLRYPTKSKAQELPRAEILNFCVRSSAQRRGVGRRLFAALCEGFAARGVSRFKIVTGPNQLAAQRFYEREGARRIDDVTIHKGTESVRYVYEIGAAACGSG